MAVIKGRLVAAESGIGVGNATVEAFFERPRSHGAGARRLGSTFTEADGYFLIEYEPPACDHESWDLKLAVSAEGTAADGNVVASCVRTDPAASETFQIRVEQKHLIRVGLLPDPDAVAQARIADEAAALRRSEERAAAQRQELASTLESTLKLRAKADETFGGFVAKLSELAGGREGGRYVAEGERIDEQTLDVAKDGVGDIAALSVASHRLLSNREIESLQRRFPRLTNIEASAVDRCQRARVPVPGVLTGIDPLDICRQQAPINDCVATLDPAVDHGPAKDDAPDAPADNDPPARADNPEAALPELVSRLTKAIQPPESPLVVDLPAGAVRPESGDIQASVDALSLRGGPADVPSVLDFSHLTMAFDSIWHELFNANALKSGRNVYEKYVELGLDPNQYLSNFFFSSSKTKKLANFSLLKNLKFDGDPPPEVSKWFYITEREWRSLPGPQWCLRRLRQKAE